MDDIYSDSDNIYELTKKDFIIDNKIKLKKDFCNNINGIIIVYNEIFFS